MPVTLLTLVDPWTDGSRRGRLVPGAVARTDIPARRSNCHRERRGAVALGCGRYGPRVSRVLSTAGRGERPTGRHQPDRGAGRPVGEPGHLDVLTAFVDTAGEPDSSPSVATRRHRLPGTDGARSGAGTLGAPRRHWRHPGGRHRSVGCSGRRYSSRQASSHHLESARHRRPDRRRRIGNHDEPWADAGLRDYTDIGIDDALPDGARADIPGAARVRASRHFVAAAAGSSVGASSSGLICIEALMTPQAIFGISVLLCLVVWGLIGAQYFWPALRGRPRAEALRPLLLLHAFRFVGLAFLVPGVVSPDLPDGFAASRRLWRSCDLPARARRGRNLGETAGDPHRVAVQHRRHRGSAQRVLSGQSPRRRDRTRPAGCRVLHSDGARTASPRDARRCVPNPAPTRACGDPTCLIHVWCSSRAHRLASGNPRLDYFLNAALRSMEQAGIPQAPTVSPVSRCCLWMYAPMTRCARASKPL